MSIDTLWFRDKIRDSLYVSQRRLAREMHLDPASLSLLLRGKRKMQLVEAEQLAQLLGVPLEEVLRHAGLKLPEMRSFPITGWVDEGAAYHELSEHLPAPGPDSLPADAQAAQIRALGDLTDGWLLFHGGRERLGPGVWGRLCLAGVEAGNVCLGFVNKSYKPGLADLRCGLIHRPPGHMEGVPVAWASPIILIQPS